ncbi:hypothetical protein [uncultured Polaribacter sp.]|uniref:DUF6973 domain-containing protein n=1 Tax=uncultured Polaribacter sp. TaxID=174711 RepID=UPI002624D082|nr:hypothetical protein [uncultured Polaribacter sp.]
MNFWNILKGLKYDQIASLSVWFVKHPIFMFATIRATFLTMKIAQKEFPYIHGEHNKANAFRHALWNLLIANQSIKFSTKIDAVLNWTKKITDWHEEFSPNERMAELMDLHNNAFGRKKFREWGAKSRNEFVILLKSELSNAVLVRKESDLKNLENNLIYLEN